MSPTASHDPSGTLNGLVDLLETEFCADPLKAEGPIAFQSGRPPMRCPHWQDCDVKEGCAIWTPIFPASPREIGDNRVMVVAEAPSTTGGRGLFIGGLECEQRERRKGEPGLEALYRFVGKHFNGAVPYFTDVVKCGSAPGQSKTVVGARAARCFKRFLREEIDAFRPQLIICIGWLARDTIKNHIESCKFKPVNEPVNLLHYSEQAHLRITPEEKEEVIWQIQIGKVSDKKVADLNALIPISNARNQVSGR